MAQNDRAFRRHQLKFTAGFPHPSPPPVLTAHGPPDAFPCSFCSSDDRSMVRAGMGCAPGGPRSKHNARGAIPAQPGEPPPRWRPRPRCKMKLPPGDKTSGTLRWPAAPRPPPLSRRTEPKAKGWAEAGGLEPGDHVVGVPLGHRRRRRHCANEGDPYYAQEWGEFRIEKHLRLHRTYSDKGTVMRAE